MRPDILLPTKLDRLFTRLDDGWGPRDQIEDSSILLRPFAERRIRLRINRIPLAICEAAMMAQVVPHGTEKRAHARLKEAAVRWMHASGSPDAGTEMLSVIPGISDAYDVTHNWIVECGNTAFAKLRNAILHPSHPRFTLIPYQWLVFADGQARRLVAVDFIWDRSLTEELRKADFARAQRAAEALELDEVGHA